MKVGILVGYIIFLLSVWMWNDWAAFLLASSSVVFWKANFKRLKGVIGEWRIHLLLKKLGEDYQVYHNVYVPKGNGQLTQVDHIIISRYQIFVLETKNYAGSVYGEEDDLYWLQRLSRRERQFYNPVRQNAGHVRALTRQVGLGDSVQSVVVFADATRLKVSPYMEGAKILHARELLAYVRKFRRKVVSRADLLHWNEVLETLQREKRRARLLIWGKHLINVRRVTKKRRDNRNVQVTSVISENQEEAHDCPNCGAKLVLRDGKYGKFYGCSSFPVCRYTVDVWKV